MPHLRKASALLAVGALCVSAAPAQAASKKQKKAPSTSAAERRQNINIAKAQRTATNAGKAASDALTQLKSLNPRVASVQTSLRTLQTGSAALATSVQNLATGTVAGLQAVNAGLAATNAKLAGSEIGVGALFRTPTAGSGANTPVHVADVWSGQIPRDGNNASMAAGTIVLALPAGKRPL